MWFNPARNVLHRLFVVLMLLFAGGAYMYVWCELFTPRWYSGGLRNRFGLIVTNTELHILTAD